MKRSRLLIIPGLIVTAGCATTSSVVLDDSKRTPISSVEIFKDKALPTRNYKVIAELSYLGPREVELKAQTRFINDAKKRGGDAIIFWPDYAGVKGGGTVFQSTAWVFKAKVIAYSPKDADTVEASSYFQGLDMDKIKAGADRGDPMAQFNLGLAYSSGQGVDRDYKEAVRWFQKAADQGLAFGQNALALMYDEGRGVQKDSARATDLFVKAASQGHTAAQPSLGFKFANGVGMPQDYIEAYKWWNVAAAQGDKTALENRDLVAKRMTPEQIAEGQRRAVSFLPRRSE